MSKKKYLKSIRKADKHLFFEKKSHENVHENTDISFINSLEDSIKESKFFFEKYSNLKTEMKEKKKALENKLLEVKLLLEKNTKKGKKKKDR